MRRLTVLGLALIALAAAAPAGGAVRTVARVPERHFGELVLAAGHATWTERHGLRWLVRDDRRTVVAVRPAWPTDYRVVELSGSPTGLGVTDTAGEVLDPGDKVATYDNRLIDRALAGPTGAPLRGMFSCGSPASDCSDGCGTGGRPRFGLDLGATAVAMTDRCHGDAGELVVQELTTGAVPFRMPVDAVAHVAMAGERIAVEDGDAIRVVDARTGADVFRLRVASLVSELAVQADGTIAVDAGGQIAWASPAAPVLHRVAATFAQGLHIAGDRILAVASRAAGPARLMLYRLDGHAVTLTRDPPAYDALDLDARRAAWAAATCGVVRVRIQDDLAHASPAPRAAPSPPCRGKRRGSM